jgi:hypothetical protein
MAKRGPSLNHPQNILDVQVADQIVRLKAFHDEYARNPVSPATEFRRGHVAEFKQLLCAVYGERVGEDLVLRVRNNVKLSVPPAGPLSEDGQCYVGWDSLCNMGFIGELH